MNYRPALLGQVRLAQTPSWGPGTGPTPLPMAPQNAPAPAAAPAEQRNIPNTIYAGGAIVAVMAAIGALLA